MLPATAPMPAVRQRNRAAHVRPYVVKVGSVNRKPIDRTMR